MIHSYLKNPVQFESEREFYIYNTLQECEGIYNFAKDFFPAECEFFMLGDENRGYNAGYSFLGRMFAMGQVQGILATIAQE